MRRTVQSCAFFAALLAGAAVAGPFNPPPTAVLTQRYDPQRTGANTTEHILTVQSVSSPEFQRLYTIPVAGQVYAQPLLVPSVPFPDGTTKNVLVVATMTNFVQAFQVDDAVRGPAFAPVPLWTASLGPALMANFIPMDSSDYGCFLQIVCWPKGGIPAVAKPLAPVGAPADSIINGNFGLYNINPSIGITSTPAIDRDLGKIFAVGKTLGASGGIEHHLARIDLVSGQIEATAVVGAGVSVPATSSDSQNGMLTFDPIKHAQRPALLLQNEKVYIAFGAHQDTLPYHGWVFAFDEHSLAMTAVWCSTPNAMGGGIWQAGSGIAGDSAGRVYVMTGNGPNVSPDTAFNPAMMNFAEMFVQLSPQLVPLASFAPSDDGKRDQIDTDLGSSGPLMMPGLNIVMGADKEARLFVLDANAGMGSKQIFQAGHQLDSFSVSGTGYHHIHGTPAVWRSDSLGLTAYFMGERDSARAYRWDDSQQQFDCMSVPGGCSNSHTAAPDMLTSLMSSTCFGCMPGGIVSISAEGGRANSGLLWLSTPFNVSGDDFGGFNTIVGGGLNNVVTGVLHAYNAEDLTQDLWNSESNPDRDGSFMFAKFNPPVVANGRVYLATFGTPPKADGTQALVASINVYGLHEWAKFLGFSVPPPASAPAGSSFAVTADFLNAGVTVWSKGQYFVSITPDWGPARFDLTQDVNPGGQISVPLQLTAPSKVVGGGPCLDSGLCRFFLALVDSGGEFGEAAMAQVQITGIQTACPNGQHCCSPISSTGVCLPGCVPDSTACQPLCPARSPHCCGGAGPTGRCDGPCIGAGQLCP